MTLPASEETVPATDAEIERYEDYMLMWPLGEFNANEVKGLIARIKLEREQAVRECAEIARTFEDWGDYSGDLETASAQIRDRILSLIERSAK